MFVTKISLLSMCKRNSNFKYIFSNICLNLLIEIEGWLSNKFGGGGGGGGAEFIKQIISKIVV